MRARAALDQARRSRGPAATCGRRRHDHAPGAAAGRLPADVPATERDRIRRAYELAARCHEGQLRKSGDPYITHPVAVAETAIDSGLDTATVCAALLHDVIEDTACDAARVREGFGDEITALVQNTTELDRCHDQAAIDAADDRALALKVLDRLHNMRTLQYLGQDRQRLKLRADLDFMAPLARRSACGPSPMSSSRSPAIAWPSCPAIPGDLSGTRLGALLLPPAARSRYLDKNGSGSSTCRRAAPPGPASRCG